jgi:hypothetical protein
MQRDGLNEERATEVARTKATLIEAKRVANLVRANAEKRRQAEGQGQGMDGDDNGAGQQEGQ